MRQHLIVTAVLLVAPTASADKAARKPAKNAPIDVKPVFDQLEVFRDDTGMVLIAPKPLAIPEGGEKWVFYGDGKTMYQQRIVGSSINGDKSEWIVWSPRVKGIAQADVTRKDAGLEVRCRNGNEGVQKLAPLAPDKRKALLSSAKFLPPLWERSARFLARDDDGVYFYVDELREEYGGKGYRVFMGKKGAMEELSMTNIVSDSAGEIYSTKTGELKIVAGADGKAYWKKGGKKVELVTLDPGNNRYLIYRDLGLYGTLGVVCDDN